MKIAVLPLCLFFAMQGQAMPVQRFEQHQYPYDDEELIEMPADVAQNTEALFELVGGEGAPVWGPFLSNLRSCAPGCSPVNYSTYRSSRHSCHNTGRAIDVGAIKCGGATYSAINGGRFAELVSCMKSKMHVIYRNGKHVTKGHHDHAHFSIGCTIAGGRSYY